MASNSTSSDAAAMLAEPDAEPSVIAVDSPASYFARNLTRVLAGQTPEHALDGDLSYSTALSDEELPATKLDALNQTLPPRLEAFPRMGLPALVPIGQTNAPSPASTFKMPALVPIGRPAPGGAYATLQEEDDDEVVGPERESKYLPSAAFKMPALVPMDKAAPTSSFKMPALVPIGKAAPTSSFKMPLLAPLGRPTLEAKEEALPTGGKIMDWVKKKVGKVADKQNEKAIAKKEKQKEKLDAQIAKKQAKLPAKEPAPLYPMLNHPAFTSAKPAKAPAAAAPKAWLGRGKDYGVRPRDMPPLSDASSSSSSSSEDSTSFDDDEGQEQPLGVARTRHGMGSPFLDGAREAAAPVAKADPDSDVLPKNLTYRTFAPLASKKVTSRSFAALDKAETLPTKLTYSTFAPVPTTPAFDTEAPLLSAPEAAFGDVLGELAAAGAGTRHGVAALVLPVLVRARKMDMYEGTLALAGALGRLRLAAAPRPAAAPATAAAHSPLPVALQVRLQTSFRAYAEAVHAAAGNASHDERGQTLYAAERGAALAEYALAKQGQAAAAPLAAAVSDMLAPAHQTVAGNAQNTAHRLDSLWSRPLDEYAGTRAPLLGLHCFE